MQALAVTFTSTPLVSAPPEVVTTGLQIIGPMIAVIVFLIVLLVGVYIIRAKRMRKNENSQNAQ